MKNSITIFLILAAMFELGSIQSIAQSTAGNNTYNSSNYLGWATAGGPLPFAIGGITNKLMQLTTGGLLGIGTNYTPAYKLDIDAGDININTATNGLRIGNGAGSKYVLWHNNHTEDLMVGIDAGNGTMTGHSNTYIGHAAGKSTTSGYQNVAIGDSAGSGITSGWYDTYVGYWAGRSAGNGDSNTGVGYKALTNSTAYDCTAMGYNCAASNLTGCSLSAFGGNALYANTTGTNNCAFGYNSVNANTALSENVGIGAYALASLAYSTGFNSYNVAVGNEALGFTNPTSSANGMQNSALGHESLLNNSTGANNSALGFQAGYSTTTGIDNVFIGSQAGYTNLASYKTYVGFKAGYLTTGDFNTFVGYLAGTACNTGVGNTFMGLDAGYAVTSSSSNSGLGLQVLGQTTTGGSNTGLGYKAGYANTTGSSNTFVGYQADANAGTYTNCAAFGNGAVTTANNKIVIGNGTVNWIGGASAWMNTSDGRFKRNVTSNVAGLDFIKKLRPVTYTFDTKALDAFVNPKKQESSTDSLGNKSDAPQIDFSESSAIVHSGFIAQEVEQASKECGFTSSIVHTPANANDPYSLGYAEFVVPLVKAVQQLDSTNQVLMARLNDMQTKLDACCNSSGSNNNLRDQGNSNSMDVQLQNAQSIVLNQNAPNPFADQTTITYFINDNVNKAQIFFYDNKGTILKVIDINEKGAGQINIYADDLSSGNYTYTLMIDGKVSETRTMIKQ